MYNFILSTVAVQPTIDDISKLSLEYERIQAYCSIIQTLCAILTVFVAILSILYAKNQYLSQKQHLKAEKAADLSKLYKNNIMPLISILLAIFQSNDELLESINKIKSTAPTKFNKNELEQILSAKEVELFITTSALTVGDFRDKDKDSSNSDKAAEKSTSPKNTYESSHSPLKTPIGSIITDVLNELESFCIYFNSGIALSNTVYQSLHQTFFDCISCLYPYIAVKNVSDCDKYFTNIISVYNEWQKEYKKQIKIDNDKEVKKQNLKAEYSNRIKNIDNESSSVVKPPKI